MRSVPALDAGLGLLLRSIWALTGVGEGVSDVFRSFAESPVGGSCLGESAALWGEVEGTAAAIGEASHVTTGE